MSRRTPKQPKARLVNPQGLPAKESSYREEVLFRLLCQRQVCPAAGPTAVALAGAQEGDVRINWATLVA